VADVQLVVGEIVATVAEGFASFDMDWWSPTEGAHPEGWGPHANILEVDLSSAKLRALAKALGPAYLRIGGSLDKFVIYADGISDEPCTPAPVPSNPTSQYHKSCLNATRWDQIHDFVAATGNQVVFGLSYPMVENETSNPSGIWNSSQAEALFQYSKKKGCESFCLDSPPLTLTP
jgi:heparanase 1